MAENTKNMDVRLAIKGFDFKNYEIAYRMGLREDIFSRLLRTELTTEKKQRILKAIYELHQERLEKWNGLEVGQWI